MPKKDGTATKTELRQAEQYERISKGLDRADELTRRFNALGFEVEGGLASVNAIQLDHGIGEQILDRLEGVRATLDLDEGDRFKLRRIERILDPQPKEE